MIDVYSMQTSNGRKVVIMLEETGLEYRYHPINLGEGEQFAEDFVAISPNGKIPAIVDSDGPDGEPISLFESGAILMYLAEKSGLFLPTEPRARYAVIQWLMFQMGGVGPMFGQYHHFTRAAPKKVKYGITRYGNEMRRLYGVVNTRLGKTPWIAGDDYSIADIALYPWVARWEWHGIDWDELPNVKHWFDAISARPAVAKAMAFEG